MLLLSRNSSGTYSFSHDFRMLKDGCDADGWRKLIERATMSVRLIIASVLI